MQDRLSSLIRTLGAFELEIESVRNTIINIAGTFPEDAFRIVDTENKGFITEADISRLFSKNGVSTTSEEIKRILKYYSLSRKDELTKSEFLNAISPRSQKALNPFMSSISKVSPDLETAVVNFFVKELQLIRKTNPYRIQLAENENWTSFDSFKLLDIKNHGSFDVHELDNFLQYNGVLITHQDLQAAFQRIDKRGNNRINYQQFKDNLLDEDSVKPFIQTKKSSPLDAYPKPVEKPKQNSSAQTSSPSYNNNYSSSSYIPRTYPEPIPSTRTVVYTDTYYISSPYKYSTEIHYDRFAKYPAYRPIYRGDGSYYSTHHYSPVKYVETTTYSSPPVTKEKTVTTIEHVSSPVSPSKTSYITTYNNLSPVRYSTIHQNVAPSTISTSVNYLDLFAYNSYGRPWRYYSNPRLESNYHYKPLHLSKFGGYGIYDVDILKGSRLYSKDDSQMGMPRGTESTMTASRYNVTSSTFSPTRLRSGEAYIPKSPLLSSSIRQNYESPTRNLRGSHIY